MSSSVYRFFDVYGAEAHRAERRNGFRSSPVIWRYIVQKYVGKDAMWLGFGPNDGIARFWHPDASKRVAVPDDGDRLLLHLTYDRALLPRSEFLRAAALLDERVPGSDSHWPDVIADLRKYADDGAILGFGFQSTTVSDDPWLNDDGALIDARLADRVQYGAQDLEDSGYIDPRRSSETTD